MPFAPPSAQPIQAQPVGHSPTEATPQGEPAPLTASFAPLAGSWIRRSTTTCKCLQGPAPASLLPPVQLGDSAISPVLKCSRLRRPLIPSRMPRQMPILYESRSVPATGLRRSIRSPRLLSSPAYVPHFRSRPPSPDLLAPVQSQNSASAQKPAGVPSRGSGTPRNVPDARPAPPRVSVPVRRQGNPSPLRHRTHVVEIDS